MAKKPKILAFAGSLREHSYSKRVVKTAIKGAETAGADVTYIDLRDYPMPIYNEDDHKKDGFSPNALKFQKLLAAHDGLLIASPEFERRVAAGAPTESIAECARATGCASMWESGMALVRSGATTADELRRVAAAPVSLVTEPRFRAPPPCTPPSSTSPTPSSVRLRIAWMTRANEVAARPVRDDLHRAVAMLPGQVEVVTVGADAPHSEALTGVDAIVLDEPGIVAAAPPSALVVAFAVSGGWGEDVRTLARDVDVILPADASGRVLLATILALLRWRSRG